MKQYNKYLVFSLATLLVTGCDLDKFPEDSIMTGDQKEEVVIDNPEMLAADVNGLAAGLNIFNVLDEPADDPYHYDYGFPGVTMMLESSGQDMIGPNVGFNWYSGSMLFSDRLYTSAPTELIWKTFYNHTKTANDIIAIVPSDTEDKTLKGYRGQALASRAFDYLNLVQAFQFTYVGHENDPAVPLVTENLTPEEMSKNPRATVKAVYDRIITDLDEAIKLLEGFVRKDKSGIDQNVAYGLRARANLLMQKGKEAAEDADKAMSGYTPYSLADVSKPTFSDVSATSWIWGMIISPENETVQTAIINWPSHLCSLTGTGYTTQTFTYRDINKNLWNAIAATDVRKGWWVNEKLESPLLADAPTFKGTYTDPSGNKRDTVYTLPQKFKFNKYTNVKFQADNNTFLDGNNASDWPLMRAEEMYLIKAEGLALSGNLGGAKSTLEDFVKAYRNPAYVCKANGQQAMIDEIWFQRRIELWGEGFAFFDIQRLKKGINRKGSNFPTACQYDLPAESKIFLYRIPEGEISVNDGISESDNNEAVAPPTI